ncbi:hypothetical protein QQF64_035972, partial [Cirrhinus molitorella]
MDKFLKKQEVPVKPKVDYASTSNVTTTTQRRKYDEAYLALGFTSTTSGFTKAASVPSNAQLASYKVAYRVARCKKPHTIAKELILPSAIDIVSTMIDDPTASKLKAIPLSNN